MPKPLLLIAATLLLTGCGKAADKAPSKAAQAMRASVAEQVARGPASQSHRVGKSGELVVLQVPLATANGLLVETQQCFVWRDTEFRTASMSCPLQPEVKPDQQEHDPGLADNGL